MFKDIPRTMRAAVIHSRGGPDVLKLEDVPVPIPKHGQVLIRVMAAGMNRSEMFTRQEHSPDVKFPRILGIEATGTVALCPDDSLKVGTKVLTAMAGLGRAHDGGYAEYTCVDVENVQEIGETGLAWDVLGAIPEMAQTAWGSLFLALGISKGDRLLIRGGTTTSLAKNQGCYVASTSRSPPGRDLILSTGADAFILDTGDISTTLQQAENFNKVLELVGVTTLIDSLAYCSGGGGAERPLGVVCMTGIAGGRWEMDGFYPMIHVPQGVAFTTYSGGAGEMRLTPFKEIIRDVEEGRLKVVVGRTFRPDEVVEAHRVMEHGGAGGKMVLLM